MGQPNFQTAVKLKRQVVWQAQKPLINWKNLMEFSSAAVLLKDHQKKHCWNDDRSLILEIFRLMMNEKQLKCFDGEAGRG